MKRLAIIALALAWTLSAGAQSSMWVFTKDTAPQWSASWTGAAHAIPATAGGDGTITVDGKDLSYGVSKNRPLLDGMKDGDSWVFALPVDKLPAGSFVSLDVTTISHRLSPKYFIVEVLDGGVWKNCSDVRPVPEDPSRQYSFSNSGYTESNGQYSTELTTFKLSSEASGEVKIRMRAVGPYTCGGTSDKDNVSWNGFAPGSYVAAYMNASTRQPVDTTRILCIGNSFTYVDGAAFMLQEIAMSQGHYLDIKSFLKGGQTCGQHLELPHSAEAVARGGYKYAFVQDQSQNQAFYAQDRKGKVQVKEDSKELSDRIRKSSPGCKIFLECTWAYPGKENGGFESIEAFDSLLTLGAKEIAQYADASVSPIGKAFALSRNERPSLPLYAADDKHQSRQGAYLKACVNYLMLFPDKTFTNDTPCCGLVPEEAAYLRRTAMRACGIYGFKENFSASFKAQKVCCINDWTPKDVALKGSAQSFGVWGRYGIMVRDKGAWQIYDMRRKSLVADGVCSWPAGHCNNISFGVEKGAMLPLVYLSECINDKRCWVVDFSEDGAHLVQTIIYKDTEGVYAGNCDWVVDRENGFIYTYGGIRWGRRPVLKFRLPSVSEGREIVYTDADCLDRWEVPYFGVAQGSCISGGYLFLTEGFPPYERALHVFDLAAGLEVKRLDLTQYKYEPEGVCVSGKWVYVEFHVGKKPRQTEIWRFSLK